MNGNSTINNMKLQGIEYIIHTWWSLNIKPGGRGSLQNVGVLLHNNAGYHYKDSTTFLWLNILQNTKQVPLSIMCYYHSAIFKWQSSTSFYI